MIVDADIVLGEVAVRSTHDTGRVCEVLVKGVRSITDRNSCRTELEPSFEPKYHGCDTNRFEEVRYLAIGQVSS